MISNYKKLGMFIRPVDERNRDLAITNLQGVSITKEFVPSIANIIGTDLSTYKIVRTGQFAYGPVTSRNGDKVSIALLKGEDCIISSSYVPFEVYKPDELLPEYLMLWFMRPEFDRYARFMSNGSAREVFDWDCMCDVELPVPPISEQRKIIHNYQVITSRIELLRRMNENLEETMETLFADCILRNEEFDFDEHIDDRIDFINGLAMQGFRPLEGETPLPVIKIRELTQGYCDDNSEYCSPSIDSSRIINTGDLVFSWSGSLRLAFWSSAKAGLNQHLFKVTSVVYPNWFMYLWTKYYLKDFQRIAENKGTTFGHIKREDLHAARIKSLDKETMKTFGKLFEPMQKATMEFSKEIQQLYDLRKIQLGNLIVRNKGA